MADENDKMYLNISYKEEVRRQKKNKFFIIYSFVD